LTRKQEKKQNSKTKKRTKPGLKVSSPGLSVPRPTHFIPLLHWKSRGYSFGILLPVSPQLQFFLPQLKYFLLKNYIKSGWV